MISAVREAHRCECNPGGEVKGAEIEDVAQPLVDVQWVRRLLSKAEAVSINDEIALRHASLSVQS